MAVFRVEKSRGYTVMSNHHLRNKELSLKAKGLLSQMLSLPEDWDYTLAGLSHINRESSPPVYPKNPRRARDERGNTYYGVDEDLRERLQSKLMRAVLSFKADK